MKKNMGTADRAIRIIVALIIGVLLLTGTLTGTVGTILGIVAIVFVLTSAFSVCPAYIPFKISTRSKSDENK